MILWLLLLLTNSDYDLILRFYNKPMTYENIRLSLDSAYRDDIVELIKRESGDLKSRLTTKGNNLLGMRKSNRNLSNGTIYGYSRYKVWIYSILDMKLWMAHSPPKKNEDFKKYLKRRKWN
jgi:hypothetical protein